MSTGANPKIGPIRILTADDHHLVRYGIAALVGAEPDRELVAQASIVAVPQKGGFSENRSILNLMWVRIR